MRRTPRIVLNLAWESPASKGFGSAFAIFGGMDFLSEPSSCEAAGWTGDAVKPPIVNMSLSGTRLTWDGREAAGRKLDAVVWNVRQLYVVANSNAGRAGFSNYAAAKNSLSVGAAWDTGELVSFSSYGPTADGRLAPLVVGTGVRVVSAPGPGQPGRVRQPERHQHVVAVGGGCRSSGDGRPA